MIQFFNPAAQLFVNGMNAIEARAERAQQQLTTGKKINSVSDEPDQIAALMAVNQQIAQNTQITSNLGRVKTETDTAESSISNAVQLMDQVSTLATQAEPTTQPADTRAQIAAQVGSILQQLVQIGNTTVEGRYIFSGDSDENPAYSIDLTQTNPVSAYQGSAATRQIQAPDGSTFAVAQTAQQIFDAADPTQNVFSTVSALRTALLNNDQTGIDNAIGNLKSASTYLNGALAFYGNAQDKVNNAINYAQSFQTQLQTQQSGIQDADLTQAITDMQQASLQQQAALAAESKMPQTTLFNYLA